MGQHKKKQQALAKQQLIDDLLDSPIPQEPPAVFRKLGVNCYLALEQSPYLHLAARYLETHQNVVVVTNGRRFWTARTEDIEPAPVPLDYNLQDERTREDWYPVNFAEGKWVIG